MFFYHAHPRKDVGLNFVLKKIYILAMIDQTYLWSIIWKLEKHSDSCFDWWKKEQSTVFEAKKYCTMYSAGLKKFLPYYIDGLSVYLSKYLVLQIFLSKKYGIRFYIFLFFDQNGVNWKHVVYNFEFLNKMTKKLL